MLPEKTNPQPAPEQVPDLFAEPRDHVNQWDVSVFWLDLQPKKADPKTGPVE